MNGLFFLLFFYLFAYGEPSLLLSNSLWNRQNIDQSLINRPIGEHSEIVKIKPIEQTFTLKSEEVVFDVKSMEEDFFFKLNPNTKTFKNTLLIAKASEINFDKKANTNKAEVSKNSDVKGGANKVSEINFDKKANTNKEEISKSSDVKGDTNKVSEINFDKKANTNKEEVSQSSDAKGDQSKIKEKAANVESSSIVVKKIKNIFSEFLEILQTESINSKSYIKVVRFLENSLYNEADFESLKLLAEAYGEKKDFKNQIKVLDIITVNYPYRAESFYLLGRAHKNLYFGAEENKTENKKKSIEYLNQALKINPKYVLAYQALLKLLMIKDPKTDESLHTKESLFTVIDMFKSLKKNKYYIPLCKAYYDNKFFKQSQKACKRSTQKNPNDPISPFVLALTSQNQKDIDKEILRLAKKFTKSFFVQYKTALYFMDKTPKTAGIYFDSAYALQPKNIKLNIIMADFYFNNEEEEKSYQYFLNICLLSKGKFLRTFRRAKSRLRRKKNKMRLVLQFQKGIDECFLFAKQNKK